MRRIQPLITELPKESCDPSRALVIVGIVYAVADVVGVDPFAVTALLFMAYAAAALITVFAGNAGDASIRPALTPALKELNDAAFPVP